MQFYVPFHFFKVPFDFSAVPKPAFCKDKAHRGTLKGGKISLFFFSNRKSFLHAFLHAISIFPSPFRSFGLPKAAFCKAIAHRGTPKRGKVSLLFSLIEWHFFMQFYVPFHFFKVPFDFSAVPKPAFCKDKAHRGTLKGGKISLFFFSNRKSFLHAFLHAISIFPSPFRSFGLPKAAFCKAIAHRGTPKRGKVSLLFSLIEWHFFMQFYVPFHFFKVPFDFASLPKAAFPRLKCIGVTPNKKKMSLLFFLIKRQFFTHVYLPFHFFKV